MLELTVDKMNFDDHEVCIIIRGKDSLTGEHTQIYDYISKTHPGVEIYQIDGGQDVYSYILILE